MPHRRSILALIALAAPATIVAGIARAAGPEDARAVVINLYDVHTARSGNPAPMWRDPATRNRLFSPALLQAFDALAAWQVENPDTVPALDGDPFWDAQDWEISDLSIGEVEALGDGIASVEVTFLNFGERKRLFYKLVDGSDGWRVDDIGYAGGYGLRKDLLATEAGAAAPSNAGRSERIGN